MPIRTLEKCNNISDFKEYENSLSISHTKMHLRSAIKFPNGKIVLFNSIALGNKYYYPIMDTTEIITLTDAEALRYRYQPKLYCYDRYRTTELWSLLLKVNNLTSISEFNLKTMRVFTDSIFQILNEIVILEKDSFDEDEVFIDEL